MRVLIFGVSGMLGHKLYQCLRDGAEVFGTVRSGWVPADYSSILDTSQILTDVDVSDLDQTLRALETVRPDVVINAVGIIKQLPQAKDVITSLSINSIFPHQLAELSERSGFRLITISTDCVFDGRRGNYSEADQPDARDLYGLSKLLGEVDIKNALTIRTSIIGRELVTSHSIVEWFLGNRGGSIEGYQKAIYTGFPTVVLADIIKGLIMEQPEMHGIWHISSDPISKLELLRLMDEAYGTGTLIEPSDEIVIDRSLNSSRFRSYARFTPETWPVMIERMASDSTPYERLRQAN